jgi:hypothetical protein
MFRTKIPIQLSSKQDSKVPLKPIGPVFLYFFQHYFISYSWDSCEAEDARIEHRIVAEFAKTIELTNHRATN